MQSKGLKKCNRCENVKPLSKFHTKGKHKGKIRHAANCKSCSKEVYHEKELKKYNQIYREKNREKINKKVRERRAKDRKQNPDKYRKYDRKYRQENKEIVRAIDRRRNKTEKRKNWEKNYTKIRMEEEPLFAFSQRIRVAVSMAFKKRNYTKKSKTFEIIGITCEELFEYIESLFLQGMTWDNKDQWHIDHIVPISFAKTEEQVIKLNHYSNLRPLWAKDNLRRGNRVKLNLDIDKHTIKQLTEIVLKKERHATD